MPLSAADVRRRGDRIRRRRTALVAGGAALAVAAVTVPILALTGHGGDPDNDLVTKDPSTSRSLGRSDLLRDEDTQYEPGSSGAFHTTDTFEGDAQATYHVCEQGNPSSLGATRSLTRTFALTPPEEASDVIAAPGEGLVEMVAEFPDNATAQAAFDTWTDWITSCTSRLGDFEHSRVSPDPETVPLTSDGRAVIYDLSWGPAPKEIDPYGDSGFINETGLVVEGHRIAVVGLTIVGQDYNFLPEDGGTPMYRMLPVAAERLLPGDQPPATPSSAPDDKTTSGDSSGVATTIPDGFVIDTGWPEPSGDGTFEPSSRSLPAFELAPCGTSVADQPGGELPTPTDRLNASWSQPEDGRARQLLTYESFEAATRAATTMVNAYRACPDEAPDAGGSTAHHSVTEGDLGDISWVVGTWSTYDGAPAVGIEALTVVQVGNALLLITGSNEGGASDPQGDIATTASSGADDAADVIAAMCVFTDAGC